MHMFTELTFFSEGSNESLWWWHLRSGNSSLHPISAHRSAALLVGFDFSLPLAGLQPGFAKGVFFFVMLVSRNWKPTWGSSLYRNYLAHSTWLPLVPLQQDATPIISHHLPSSPHHLPMISPYLLVKIPPFFLGVAWRCDAQAFGPWHWSWWMRSTRSGSTKSKPLICPLGSWDLPSRWKFFLSGHPNGTSQWDIQQGHPARYWA